MKKNRINYGSDGPLKKGNQNLIRLFSTTKNKKAISFNGKRKEKNRRSEVRSEIENNDIKQKER